MALESKPGVSIIVCCYNSSKRLPETIKHISSQKVPDEISWELIIINNNSSDDTKTVAKEEIEKYKVFENRSFIIDESRPGLTQARDTGFKNARFECVIMCDDDNWLNSNYVKLAYEIINQSPDIGAIGALGTEYLEVEKPYWFEQYKATFAVGRFSNVSGNITNSNNGLYGAGACVRRSAYLSLVENGFTPLSSDRIGDVLMSGGDSEIFWALELAGFFIWYDDRLTFTHFISKKALCPKNFLKKMYYGTRSEIILRPYSYLMKNKSFIVRSSIKKDWRWLFLAHLIPFLAKGRFLDILIFKITQKINNRIVTSHVEYGKIIQIFTEKNYNLVQYANLKNSKWLNLKHKSSEK
ncbi:glycosyltransferase [Pedobacter chitinilyticus]|uniref:Glycosyltransferase family 2 protein n=1 Tax=Pedobacter chitinilyticus TaxID=2233776 RepID=A0A443YX89_9SPHI|nr:glycosyltransferase [Pedobacter chitinilyticus]RWU08600.1 glycosyltransferase family 2 protein [Pedobacter chitinilyticus]